MDEEKSIVPVDNQDVTIDDYYDEALKVVKTIKICQANLRVNQFKIALELKKANDNKLYTALGYKNIADFALHELGYKKANCYLMLKVADNFLDLSDKDKIKSIFADDSGDFGFSQLAELTHITVDQNQIRELIESDKLTFDSTVKDIRNLSKDVKNPDAKKSVSGEKNKKQDSDENLIFDDTILDENKRLKTENEVLKSENEKIKAENEELKARIKELEDAFLK